MTKKTPHQQRLTRHKRIRSRISGTAECPRLSIYRSNRCIYAQLIDDASMTTLAAAHDMEIKSGNKIEKAKTV